MYLPRWLDGALGVLFHTSLLALVAVWLTSGACLTGPYWVGCESCTADDTVDRDPTDASPTTSGSDGGESGAVTDVVQYLTRDPFT